MDLSFQTILYRLIAMLVLVGLHGFIVAAVSRAFGAKSPQYDGRLTPNPLVHLDLLAVVPFLLCQIGWIRPVKIETEVTQPRKYVGAAIAMISLAITVGVVVAVWAARPAIVGLIDQASAAAGVTMAIRVLLSTTAWFALFNILPLPPLTMGMSLSSASAAAAHLFERHGLGIRIVLVVVALAAASSLRPLHDAVLHILALGRL